MITKCPVCGKAFDVLWPQLWAYREGNVFMCTWKCLRKARKEAERMESKRRDRYAVADEMIRMMEAGQDPIVFLKSLGYINPAHAYSDLRTLLKKTRPEMFKRLPENLKEWKKRPEIPEPVSGGPWEKMEVPEKEAPVIEITPDRIVMRKPTKVDYGGFLMDVIRSPETGARYEFKENLLFVKYGPDEFVMEPKDWRKLIDEIPKAAAVLGVEL